MDNDAGDNGLASDFLTIKFSGDSFDIKMEVGLATVEDLKRQLCELTGIEEDRQKLVYAGRVLLDADLLADVGIANGSIVYLVRTMDSGGSISSPSTSSSTEAPSTRSTPLEDTLPSLPDKSRLKSANPFAKLLLDNPEMMKSMFMSNPKLEKVFEKMPQLRHAFQDPAVLKDMIRMSSDPEYYKETMKGHDRMLSHLENIPQGWQALQQMYNQLNQPLTDAFSVEKKLEKTDTGDSDPNRNLNNEPLPNPWGRHNSGSRKGSKALSPGLGRSMPEPKLSAELDENFDRYLDDPQLLREEMKGGLFADFIQQMDTKGAGESKNKVPDPTFGPFNTSFASITPAQKPTASLDISAYETRFAEQLQALNDMGFTDKQANIRALLAAGGNLNSAVDRLLRQATL